MDSVRRPAKSKSNNHLLPSPARGDRKTKSKSKSKNKKGVTRSRSRKKLFTKKKSMKSQNKSKPDSTPQKLKTLKSGKNNLHKKNSVQKFATPQPPKAKGELPMITINQVRNSGQNFGIFQVSLENKELAKMKNVKEKRGSISKRIQSRKSKKGIGSNIRYAFEAE